MALWTVTGRLIRPLTGSLRTKIIVWFFVPTAIILVAVALVNFYSYQRVTEDLVFERNRDLTQLLAARLAIKLGSFPRLLTEVSRSSGITEQDNADSQANLVQASTQLGIFDAGVLVLDASGTITATHPYRPDLVGQDWSAHPITRRVLESQEAVISDVLQDGSNSSDVIEVAIPISGEQGEFLGSMIGMFRLRATTTSTLYGEMSKLRIGNGGSYIVDGNGRVIYHDDPERVGSDLRDQQPVTLVLQGEAGAIRTRTEGKDVVSAFSPIPGTDWGLVTEESWSALISGSRDFQRFLLLLLALGVALPAVFVSIGLKRVMRPVEELTRAVKEVARGNFGQTISVHSGDEIEELATEFNLMAEQLQGSYEQLLQRTEESEALFKISSVLGQPGSYEDKLHSVIQELGRVAEADWMTLRMPDPHEGGLGVFVRVETFGLPLQGSHRAPSADAIAAFETGQPMVDNDYQSRPGAAPWAIAEGAKSVLLLPIKGTKETLAVASVVSREPDHFNPERVRLLTAIADGIGPFLETARLDGQIREELERRRETEARLLQRSRELEALFKISNIFGQPGTYAHKLNAVMQELLRIAEASWVSLAVPDPQDGGARILFRVGAEGHTLPVLQRGNTLTLQAMESGEPMVVNDYPSHPDALAPAIAEGVRSVIALPIKGTEEILAVAGAVSKEANHFNPERVRLLTAIVDGFGVFLESARLQQDLLDSNDQLSEALDVLKATQEHIVQQERLHALGTMASGIAHDFNNALAPILGYSEMILEDADQFDESTVKYLQVISTSAKDAAAVVGRLREFYRQREGSELMMAVDINDVVARVISLTQPRWRDMALAKGIDIQLTTQLTDDLPKVSGDEAELRTALGNVIFNAVDAMPGGGTITLRTFQDNEEVVLEVTDTGMGMSDEVLSRAMEPFFTTKEEQGTGMGLAMVYGTLQRHNGKLEIRSEVGKGTTIGFHLPVITEEQEVSIPSTAEPLPAGLRFLVVDDEPRVRDMVGEFLRREGSTVETATNGRDALEKFHRNQFDLVITDRGMPEMNGDALAAAIKEEAPNTPIIMLTGFGEMMISAGEKPPGVDCLLGKPVTPAALRQAVATVRAEYVAKG